jgi:hypothetical protein
LSIASQNQWREVGAEHVSRFSGLLRVEASLTRASQSGLKISGGATTVGARGIIVDVASSESSKRWVGAIGCVGPLYPEIVISSVLGPRVQ